MDSMYLMFNNSVLAGHIKVGDITQSNSRIVKLAYASIETFGWIDGVIDCNNNKLLESLVLFLFLFFNQIIKICVIVNKKFVINDKFYTLSSFKFSFN